MTDQRFVLELGRAMHAAGSPAYRVEDTMTACARGFGLDGSFFATPTAIFASLTQPDGRVETALLRVEPGAVDLSRLSALYQLSEEVVRGRLASAPGLERLRALLAVPAPWGRWAPVLAQGLAAAAACAFLGGGSSELLVAGAIGVLIGLLALLTAPRPALVRVFEPAVCALAAFLAHAASVWLPPLNPSLTTLAGVVVLLPGLALTTALNELALRHLSAGSARLLGAVTALLTMVVGVGIGSQVGRSLLGTAAVPMPAVLPGWAWGLSLLAFGAAVTVLLRAERRALPWVLLAVVVAWLGAAAGRAAFGSDLGPFAGAFLVALVANAYARGLRRPAATLRIPGLLFLVPGSLGFRGLAHLLEHDPVQGIDLGFRMLLVAASLVAGLLLAGAVLPPPRDS